MLKMSRRISIEVTVHGHKNKKDVRKRSQMLSDGTFREGCHTSASPGLLLKLPHSNCPTAPPGSLSRQQNISLPWMPAPSLCSSCPCPPPGWEESCSCDGASCCVCSESCSLCVPALRGIRPESRVPAGKAAAVAGESSCGWEGSQPSSGWAPRAISCTPAHSAALSRQTHLLVVT